MNKQKWLLRDPGNGRVAPLHEINTDQQLLFFVYFFSSPASQSFMISKKGPWSSGNECSHLSLDFIVHVLLPLSFVS